MIESHNMKIPVLAIGYFSILTANDINTTLFEFYPVPLNPRQQGVIKEKFRSRQLELRNLDAFLQSIVSNTKQPIIPLAMVVDTIFNDFKELFTPLEKYKDKIKVILCLQTPKNEAQNDIRRIMENINKNLELMIILFEGTEEENRKKIKDFFESTDFILSNAGFINISLLDFINLGDIIFFSKFTSTEIKELQDQVMKYINMQLKQFTSATAIKLIISFKTPTNITVTQVTDALELITAQLPHEGEIQWGLYVSDRDLIEVSLYLGLGKELFLKKDKA